MVIDWNAFTPFTSLAGGVLIGIAASLLLAGLGRIAGITGIVADALQMKADDLLWRLCFIIGLVTAPSCYLLFSPLPLSEIATDWPTIIVAGLIVGFGSRLGSGCTSGHGVCGISRGSKRSILATMLFMLTGFITVFVVRHLFASGV
ncbi:YeeE/YedE family protein [Undibacterium sp. LX40W]|uniref:YeeE/YedE family protein n=1 Tax=Undibacterium nitidum TaxID=2762298 RepID=A0A923HRH5_9BURK|nr:YeeE/YedE family protein [Undibacterium nitidum]MBC3892904.1 YeeE/YedE family protein [Undibacterium sp. LX40W]